MLPSANSIPAMAKSRPIRPGDAPAACNSAGASSAGTAVVTPAMTIAAAVQIMARSEMTARRLAPTRADGVPEPAGIRSAASPVVITAKTAAVASAGIASPKYWTSAPEAAGPATPPTPAQATDPPRLRPPGPAAAAAIQESPAVHTTP